MATELGQEHSEETKRVLEQYLKVWTAHLAHAAVVNGLAVWDQTDGKLWVLGKGGEVSSLSHHRCFRYFDYMGTECSM